MDNLKDKKLWDIVVRVFHWSLVIFVLIAFISSDEGEGLHQLAGYVILSIVLFRIVWGFVGTKYARFSEFVKGPRKVFAYLKGLFTGSPPYYFGHNPAGGLMIVAILVTLLCVAFTGIKTGEGERREHASIDNGSPRFSITSVAHAADDYFKRSHKDKRGSGKNASHEMWEEVHEFFAGLLLVLIALHVTAVLMTWIVYKENLIKSMITGTKPVEILPRR